MEQTIEQKYENAFRTDRPMHKAEDEFAIRHPKMLLGQRAKIFSPFAALRGFEEEIDSKLETYVSKKDISEDNQARINQTLLELDELMKTGGKDGSGSVVVTVVFYVPCSDENHEAYGLYGKYVTLTGKLWKIDPVILKAIRVNDMVIDFSDILEIRIGAQTEEGE